MKQKLKTPEVTMPTAAPSEEEIRDWQALPRDQQLARMRETLQGAVKSGLSERSMDDIKADALKRLAK